MSMSQVRKRKHDPEVLRRELYVEQYRKVGNCQGIPNHLQATVG
jgi:hypothetical protein